MDDTLKFYNYTSVYRKDYLKRKFKKTEPFVAKQMFKDPVLEGFKNYLEIGKDQLREFEEDGDQYLEKVKSSKKKIGKMYFEEPLDSITIKENKLLDGKTVYQVDYCDVEGDIRRKLLDTERKMMVLPDGWVIPVTTQKYDFRNPTVLWKDALKRVSAQKPIENLGKNEKINEILNVKTGESEYNGRIGELGEFIVVEHIHGIKNMKI